MGTAYWHLIKSTAEFGAAEAQRVWDEERAGKFISAGYGNEPDGLGRKKLAKYANGDGVFVYVPERGLVAVGVVRSESPTYVDQDRPHEHSHRRAVEWLVAVEDVADAIPIAKLRDRCGVNHPRTLTVRINENAAACMEQALRRHCQNLKDHKP